jgi:hypothetical protein
VNAEVDSAYETNTNHGTVDKTIRQKSNATTLPSVAAEGNGAVVSPKPNAGRFRTEPMEALDVQ